MDTHREADPTVDETSGEPPRLPPFRFSERLAPIDADDARLQLGDLIVLIGTTTRVLDDCRIANGAVVVSPSHLPSYPVEAPDGMACRPGESLALTIASTDALGRNERNSILAWLTARAAGFNDDGYLRRSYAIHGRVTDRRPDRMGTALLLWAICALPERSTTDPVRAIVRQLAAGLSLGRDRRQASPSPTVDLAESALSAMALHSVFAILPADEWERAANREDERRDALMGPVLGQVLAGSEPETADPVASPRAAVASNAGPRRLFPDDGSEQAALVALSWVPGIDVRLRDAVLDRLMVVLLPEDADPESRVRVTDLFWLAIGLEKAGRSGPAGDLFAAAIDLADADGHFPEWVRSPGATETPSIPSLAAHLTFLLATSVLGRLRDLPPSGFTAARRRS